MELPENFPKSMAEVYQRQPNNKITDPRVKESWGGGYAPEQHWGWLHDGRCFFLRIRSGAASLSLGTADMDPNEDLPQINPQFNREEFDRAYEAGVEYPHSFWLQPRPQWNIYPKDPLWGAFKSDWDRNTAFALLLDEIDTGERTLPEGTGWCAPSP